jgi:hypothetical protein
MPASGAGVALLDAVEATLDVWFVDAVLFELSAVVLALLLPVGRVADVDEFPTDDDDEPAVDAPL